MKINKEISPPHNNEIEIQIIGEMMIGGITAIYKAITIIDSNDFYFEKHQILFETIFRVACFDKNYSMIQIIEELTKNKQLEIVGGSFYLADIMIKVPINKNIEKHCQILKEYSLRRQLIKTNSELIQKAYDNSEDVFEILEKNYYELENTLNKITETKAVSIGEIGIQFIKNMQLKKETGLLTQFEGLNEKTGGFHKKDYIIITAAPNLGKSAFLHSLLNFWSDKSILLFSLEMSKETNLIRQICMNTNVAANTIRQGKLYDSTIENIRKFNDKLENRKHYIIDNSISINELLIQIKKLDKLYKFDCVIIDYLQLIKPTKEKGRTRENEVSDISRKLKELAMDSNFPIIAASQLSREIFKTKNKEIQLHHLRESGSLEQDTDFVIGINRPFYWLTKEQQTEMMNEIEYDGSIDLLKNRHTGMIGRITLNYDRRKGMFFENENEKEEKEEKIVKHFQETEKELDIPF